MEESIMLYQKLKTDFLTARKENNKVLKALLSTLVGEVSTAEKDGTRVDDQYIVKKARVYIANITQYVNSYSEEAKQVALEEKAYLESLIPQQLTEDEIKVIVKDYSDIKTLMSFMSSTYAGRYDGKLVNRLFTQK